MTPLGPGANAGVLASNSSLEVSQTAAKPGDPHTASGAAPAATVATALNGGRDVEKVAVNAVPSAPRLGAPSVTSVSQPDISADTAVTTNASQAYGPPAAPNSKSAARLSALPVSPAAASTGAITPVTSTAAISEAALPAPVATDSPQGLIGPAATVAPAAASMVAQLASKQVRETIKGEAPLPTTGAESTLLTTPDTTPARPAGSPVLNLTAVVGSHEIPQALASQVSWMIDRDMNGAKMQVNPPHLGPIEVQVSLNGDRAQVWFGTHSDAAREALQSSFPQLREMLGAQGFSNVSVDVSQHSFQQSASFQQSYNGQQREPQSAPTTLKPAIAESPVVPLGSRVVRGVDAYA